MVLNNLQKTTKEVEEENNKKIKNKNNILCLIFTKKPLFVNLSCLLFLLFYSIFGGYIFLYFEENNWKINKKLEFIERLKCVEYNLNNKEEEKEEEKQIKSLNAKLIANRIVVGCILSQIRDERMEWNLKNAALFGFGILTTLGYGKIEPRTTEGRLFTVFYGFIGVPFTVIIFTNFGRYLQNFEKYLRKQFWKKLKLFNKKRRKTSLQILKKNNLIPSTLEKCEIQIINEEEENQQKQLKEEKELIIKYLNNEEEKEEEEYNNNTTTSPINLIIIIIIYLLLGALLINWLDKNVDFINGIYFAFLCLTAIEYGKLIPLNLRVRELLVALGQNIGLEPTVLCDLDLEKLISNAIQVKEGRLNKVPQTHMIMDGIWPPELVPLFLRDGQFPDWVDADDRRLRKWSAISLLQVQKRLKSSLRGGGGGGNSSYSSKQSEISNRKASNRSTLRTITSNNQQQQQPPERTPPLPPERLSVRFEEFIHSNEGKEEEEKYSLEISPINKYFILRKSETVPSTNNPDISLARLCTFPSLDFRYKNLNNEEEIFKKY